MLWCKEIERNDEWEKRIEMGGEKKGIIEKKMWMDGVKVIGKEEREGVIKDLEERRREVIGKEKDVKMLIKKIWEGVIIVEKGEIEIVEIVKGMVEDGLKERMEKIVENVMEGKLREGKGGGVGNVEIKEGWIEELEWGIGLRMEMIGEERIKKEGKEVIEVKLDLEMEEKEEGKRNRSNKLVGRISNL